MVAREVERACQQDAGMGMQDEVIEEHVTKDIVEYPNNCD